MQGEICALSKHCLRIHKIILLTLLRSLRSSVNVYEYAFLAVSSAPRIQGNLMDSLCYYFVTGLWATMTIFFCPLFLAIRSLEMT